MFSNFFRAIDVSASMMWQWVEWRRWRKCSRSNVILPSWSLASVILLCSHMALE